MRHLYIIFITVFVISLSQAQDIHYTQFYQSDLNINPALTGIFNGDKRFVGSYRQQWYSVPVDYLTFTGSYDQKIYREGDKKGFFSVGGLMNYDQAGDSRLTLVQLSGSGSYTYLLNKKNLLTLGLQIGGAYRQFSDNDLQWDNQFDGVMFDPMLSSGEEFPQTNFLLMNGSVGLNYRWQKSARTNVDFGAGMMNLFSTDASFYEEDFPLSNRYSIHLQSSLKLSQSLDFMIMGLAQFQAGASMYVPGAILRMHLNQKRGKEFALDIGAIARLGAEEFDAIAPKIGFQFSRWYVTFSYDITLSEFEVANSRVGGPEVHVQFLITEVKPLNTFKTCPIF